MDVAQGEEKADHEHVDHGGVRLPVGSARLLHPSMGAQLYLVLIKKPVRKHLRLKLQIAWIVLCPGEIVVCRIISQ